MNSILSASMLSATVTDVKDDTIVIHSNVSIQKGMYGKIVHHLEENHEVVIASFVTTSAYNKETNSTKAKLEPFDLLHQDALPSFTYKVEKGDEALLAFGYDRALLITPSENIYYTITKSARGVEWISPDRFAAFLSYEGHPTPLKEDFTHFCEANAIGLVYIYVRGTLYTLDAHSFKVVQTTPVSFKLTKKSIPFYSRVQEIDAAWWGEGSDRMVVYDLHYLQLLEKFNKNLDLKKAISIAQEEKAKKTEPIIEEMKRVNAEKYNPLHAHSRRR